MSLTLTISKIHFPDNEIFAGGATVALYISPYYNPSFSLIQDNVLVNPDGTINESPLPTTTIDPTQKYILRCINKACFSEFDQILIVSPYCPPGYTMAPDESYCFYQITIAATPPTDPLNTAAMTNTNYSVWASLIYNPGFNINGTGPFTQIPFTNPFWVNGAGYPTGAGNNLVLGPMNRSGLWATVALPNATIGFAVCITVTADATYYVGCGADNSININLDGVAILQMDPTAVGVYLSANGYPGVGVESAFRFWHIYPVQLTAGTHILEVIGVNDADTTASMGAEVYANTPSQIEAATSYSGLNLVFSSKDYIGQPVQLGSSGIGYSCPVGYALEYCGSPIVCVKTVTTPVLY